MKRLKKAVAVLAVCFMLFSAGTCVSAAEGTTDGVNLKFNENTAYDGNFWLNEFGRQMFGNDKSAEITFINNGRDTFNVVFRGVDSSWKDERFAKSGEVTAGESLTLKTENVDIQPGDVVYFYLKGLNANSDVTFYVSNAEADYSLLTASNMGGSGNGAFTLTRVKINLKGVNAMALTFNSNGGDNDWANFYLQGASGFCPSRLIDTQKGGYSVSVTNNGTTNVEARLIYGDVHTVKTVPAGKTVIFEKFNVTELSTENNPRFCFRYFGIGTQITIKANGVDNSAYYNEWVAQNSNDTYFSAKSVYSNNTVHNGITLDFTSDFNDNIWFNGVSVNDIAKDGKISLTLFNEGQNDVFLKGAIYHTSGNSLSENAILAPGSSATVTVEATFGGEGTFYLYAKVSAGAKVRAVINNLEWGKIDYGAVAERIKSENSNTGVGTAVYADEVKITSRFIELGSDIALKIKANVVDKPQSINLNVSFNGKNYVTDTYTVDSDGAFLFDCINIAPHMLGDEFNAELIIDGKTVDEKTGSVKEYLSEILAGSYGEKTDNLVKDLLVYGGAAQRYMNYNTAFCVDEGVTGRAWTDIAATDFAKEDIDVSVCSFKAANMWFNNKNMLYFRFTADDLSKVKVVLNGQDCTDIRTVEGKEGKAAFTVPLSPKEFDSTFVAELYYDGVLCQKITYSVKSYVFSKQGKTGAMSELAKAVYNYGLSAKEY